MAASPIPETFHRQDWPRLVARKTGDHETRIKALEAGGGGGASFSGAGIDLGSSGGASSAGIDLGASV